MATCKCFRCGTAYESTNEEDIVGDGKCAGCTERSKQIAFKIDIEMSNKRREKTPSLIRQMFTEDQIRDGMALDEVGRILSGAPANPINFKQLGITPSD